VVEVNETYFISGKIKVSATHEGAGVYRVTVHSVPATVSRYVVLQADLFIPEFLAHHKAAHDVLLQDVEAGHISKSDLRWMRHRSGDDGPPMLVLTPRTDFAAKN